LTFSTASNSSRRPLRTLFGSYWRRTRAEGLYSFALYSDEGALTVCPSANSLAHLATQPLEDQLYAKFESAEWDYERRGAEAQFNELNRQLRTCWMKRWKRRSSNGFASNFTLRA
jgi:hypothetical protein